MSWNIQSTFPPKRSSSMWVCFVLMTFVVVGAEPLPPLSVAQAWPPHPAFPDVPIYLGDIRAVIEVSEKDIGSDGLVEDVQIWWRRRDALPAVKSVMVLFPALPDQPAIVPITSVAVSSDCGVISLNTTSFGPGTYHIYYMPYVQTGGGASLHFHWYNCSHHDVHACVLGSTSEGICAQEIPTTARVAGLETRNEFHGFTTMELAAVPSEIQALSAGVKAQNLPFAVFIETRDNELRMFEIVPALWARRAASEWTNTSFERVQVGEFFTFQIGLYALLGPITNVTLEFSDFTPQFAMSNGPSIPAESCRCFNLGGVSYNGTRFSKNYTVSQDNLGALWVGVDIPPSASLVNQSLTATLTLKSTTHQNPVHLSVTLNLVGPIADNHGYADTTTKRRLAWLDSMLEASPQHIPDPFVPVTYTSAFTPFTHHTLAPDFEKQITGVTCLNKFITLNPLTGLPSQISVNAPKFRRGKPTFLKHSLLKSDVSLELVDMSGRSTALTAVTPPTISHHSDACIAWESVARSPSLGIEVMVEGELAFDSHVEFVVTLTNSGDVDTKLADVKLVVPLSTESAVFMAGLEAQGSAFGPLEWRWSDTAQTNKIWAGRIDAGLVLGLKGEGDAWNSPTFNQDYPRVPFVPRSWGGVNALGKDNPNGVNVTVDGTIVAFSGPRTLSPGEFIVFRFDLALTPSKVLNMSKHWEHRTVQVGYGTGYMSPQDVAAMGATIVTLHQGIPGMVNGSLAPNPYINYPFDPVEGVPLLTNYTMQANGLGMRTKFYYTVRELSNHAAELFPLLSLQGEILLNQDAYDIPQPGYCQDWDCHGGEVFLHQHIGSNYTFCWQNTLGDGEWDAAVCDHGVSRWLNYYVEGLSWSMQHEPYINGVYYDGINFDRLSMQRVRRAATAAALAAGRGYAVHFDLHTGHDPGPPVCSYASHYPYVDEVWNGEGFDFSQGPIYWLVEVSNHLHGVTGDRLGGSQGGDDFKGMLFGMAQRNTQTAQSLWALWDSVGISGMELVGWWEDDVSIVKAENYTCPNAPDPQHATVVVSAYINYGHRALLSIASFCGENTTVSLSVDWAELGLDAKGCVVYAPDVPGVQGAAQVASVNGPFVITGNSGLLLVIDRSSNSR